MNRDLLPFAGSLVLALILGITLGEIHGRLWTIQKRPIVFTEDMRPKIPVVIINDISNGTINGTMTGTVRVFGGEEILHPQHGSFSIPLDSLKRVVAVSIPDGMKFVASKNGKKYYPVSSKSGMKIVQKNRIYFPDSKSAEARGLIPGK